MKKEKEVSAMKTEYKILQLAVERLMNDLETLKQDHHALRKEVIELRKQNRSHPIMIPEEPKVPDTVLLNTKEVLNILGVCYNTPLKC